MRQVDYGAHFAGVVGPIKMVRGCKRFPPPPVRWRVELELENRFHQLAEIPSEPEGHLVLYIPRATCY